MKTIQIIDHLKQGGAQRIVTGAVKNLPSTKIIPLRVSYKKYSGVDWGIAEGQYLFPPGKNNIIHLWRLLRSLRLILDEDVDIIHFHLEGSWLFSIFLHVISPLKNRPVFLYTEHSTWLAKKWFYPNLIKMISKIGYLIPESEYSMDLLLAIGALPEKTFLLRNYIDLEAFSPKAENYLTRNIKIPRANSLTKVIGFAGRLVYYKHWDYFLDIAEILRNENIVFLIAGDGAEREKVFAEIKSRNLVDKVFMLGYVNSISDFYHSIDIFASLSERETFGLSIMEAQACGTPVLAFDGPFSRELGARKTFITIEPGNIKCFSEEIIQLLENKQKRDLLIRAGLENTKKFGLNNYLDNLKIIYAHILEQEERST